MVELLVLLLGHVRGLRAPRGTQMGLLRKCWEWEVTVSVPMEVVPGVVRLGALAAQHVTPGSELDDVLLLRFEKRCGGPVACCFTSICFISLCASEEPLRVWFRIRRALYASNRPSRW